MAKKETVVFRVISSRHKAEGRWMYPEVKGADLLGKTFRWAEEMWANTMKQIENELNR